MQFYHAQLLLHLLPPSPPLFPFVLVLVTSVRLGVRCSVFCWYVSLGVCRGKKANPRWLTFRPRGNECCFHEKKTIPSGQGHGPDDYSGSEKGAVDREQRAPLV